MVVSQSRYNACDNVVRKINGSIKNACDAAVVKELEKTVAAVAN